MISKRLTNPDSTVDLSSISTLALVIGNRISVPESMRRTPSILLLLFAVLPVTLTAQTTSKQPSDPPKPVVTVSFERNAIKESDAIQVWVWFTNEGDQSLSKVTLHINSPASIDWNASDCARWNDNARGLGNQPVNIGSVGPHEIRPITICAKSGPNIDVGEFNILFAFDYSWTNNNIERHSIVTAEKQLKANLFGSDTVAGIPIALASFIVPGLFFWFVLAWFRPSSTSALALGDKLIYSVLISLPLLWIVNRLSPNTGAGISFAKLGVYAITGVAAGAVIGGGDWLWRWDKNRRATHAKLVRERNEVKIGDAPEVLLGKLLHAFPVYHSPRAVLQTADGKKYEGSLAAGTDSAVAIVGWFQIDREKIASGNKAEILTALNGAKRPLDLFELAQKYTLTIEGSDPIRVLGGTAITDLGLTLPNKDVDVETLDGQGSKEPLVLV